MGAIGSTFEFSPHSHYGSGDVVSFGKVLCFMLR